MKTTSIILASNLITVIYPPQHMFSASRTTVSSHLARLVLIESDTYLWEKLGQNTSRALGGVGWGERVFEPLVEFVLTLKHVTSVIVSLSSHPLWCVDQKPSERGSYFFSWIRRSVLLTIYMLFASWEVRMVKNCDRRLENAARGRRPRAAFSRPRSQFFTIRTDP